MVKKDVVLMFFAILGAGVVCQVQGMNEQLSKQQGDKNEPKQDSLNKNTLSPLMLIPNKLPSEEWRVDYRDLEAAIHWAMKTYPSEKTVPPVIWSRPDQ
jgi:hypothetical protein